GVIATMGGARYWAGNRTLLTSEQASITSEVEALLESLEDRGETPVIVGQEQTILGVVALSDVVRRESAGMIKSLYAAGVKQVVMLTGDTKRVALAVGEGLGLKEAHVFGNLLPEDKVTQIETLTKAGPVAFVGDGVNDAAALATARVGIAMGVAGTDAALEAADVALLSSDLRKLVYTYTLSRRANRIIRQNLYFACGIMAVMVVATIFTTFPLPLGVIGHEGGTLLVVANGLRLLFMKEEKLG
nr:HAD-IC family P-type ATPase [Candidatus Paceibacterota bacterium]